MYYMAMKLDMAKAYDRVEWPSLYAMLHKLGFDDIFYKWVMECVQTVTYSVVVNGETTGYITPSRGIRQGDPLSPFLFLICAEGFSSLLHHEERMGRIHGMSVTTIAEPISHVFFMDDSALFCQATELKVANIKCLLQRHADGF